jgi:hypothetical protein
MTQKHLVLNGPHKGQWYPGDGVLHLIDPTPPRSARWINEPCPTDTCYTTYNLRAFVVEDDDKRVVHYFWQTQETERGAPTMLDQLLALVGHPDESP